MAQNKDAYYFSHDSNAHQDEKILDLRAKWGWEGYGLFWGIVELMREQTDYQLSNSQNLPQKISLQLNIDSEKAQQFIDDCVEIGLFNRENGSLYSESLLRRMAQKDKRSEQARKAARARWDNESNGEEQPEEGESNADAMRTQCNGKDSAMPKKEKKRKENKNNKDKSNSRFDPSTSEKYNEYAPITGNGLDYDAIKEKWNQAVPEDLRVYQMTDKRKRKLRKRYKEPNFSFQEIINAISEQEFLLGANDRGWVVDFTWVIESQEHYTKILERKYKDRKVSNEEAVLEDVMEWAREEDRKEVQNGKD